MVTAAAAPGRARGVRWVAAVGLGALLISAIPKVGAGQVAKREFDAVCGIADHPADHETAPSFARDDHLGAAPVPSAASIVLRGMIRVYQKGISRQSMRTCNFVPSCSHYGEQALRLRQPGLAVLMISDRLQRCNGLPGMRGQYPIDRKTGRFLDPVP